MTNKEIVARYRAKNRLAGKCWDCARPAPNGIRCEKHRRLHNIDARWRAKHKEKTA